MSVHDNETKKKDILRLSNAASHQLTKECIHTALIYLMNEQPFEKITVTSIIKRSGVSRAAFYRNYTSKEEVLREIGQNIYEVISSTLTKEKYQTNPRQWYEDCFSEIRKNAGTFQLMIQAQMPPDFIAYDHRNKQNLSRLICRKEFGTLSVAWTIRSQEELEKNKRDFDLFIFEGFEAEK